MMKTHSPVLTAPAFILQTVTGYSSYSLPSLWWRCWVSNAMRLPPRSLLTEGSRAVRPPRWGGGDKPNTYKQAGPGKVRNKASLQYSLPLFLFLSLGFDASWRAAVFCHQSAAAERIFLVWVFEQAGTGHLFSLPGVFIDSSSALLCFT